MGWVFEAESADEQGLVGIGADLEPETILAAYASGVFPTRFEPYCDPEWPMFWWSPDPRAIIELDGFQVSRRLARTIRSGRFQIAINRDFRGVMLGCADREEGTWITHDVVAAYTRLFELGYAHSVEVWKDSQLVGGTYGLAIGGLFAAESKFHRVTDASKIALAALVEHLNRRGYQLLDIQMVTPHTASLGAIEIPRKDYLRRLSDALAVTPTFVDA
jgi:leucyl/phenylalanyl-tRNA--protein transferase